ncbi:hypothetical protein CEXT_243191 [Caerostris extrusa]|uniref:Uncharacterized protein n=1 Tax=Caerostris extrusa TaxID=172846 RepID=A0AAV4RYX0_CAEEX|nr:hypothetical protein CEXT_243191 [Caerostris extrusa]
MCPSSSFGGCGMNLSQVWAARTASGIQNGPAVLPQRTSLIYNCQNCDYIYRISPRLLHSILRVFGYKRTARLDIRICSPVFSFSNRYYFFSSLNNSFSLEFFLVSCLVA